MWRVCELGPDWNLNGASHDWHDRLSSILSSMDYIVRVRADNTKEVSFENLPTPPHMHFALSLVFPVNSICLKSWSARCVFWSSLRQPFLICFCSLFFASRALTNWVTLIAYTQRCNKKTQSKREIRARQHLIVMKTDFRWLCTASQTWSFSINRDIICLNLASRWVQ